MSRSRSVALAALAPLCLTLLAVAARPEVPVVSFDREVRSILSENCFKCHGPDPKTRLAGLRLDTFAGATTRLADGRAAIVPGDPVASSLLERLDKPHGDPLHMPPAATNKRVRPEQVETLRRWIAQGARYEEHWSFIPPRRPAVPIVAGAVNPVDAFIRTKLREKGLAPSPEADRRTLIRRVSLDLIGLPPTPQEVDDFVGDTQPGAYERVVDRLLANPHYGERMAIGWLDLARYADTHGYHIDSQRDMYRWRDWVIDSFNRDKPYDTFVTEQLAGDLLPGATLDQRIATGFNRNHPINFEGGAIPDEYQVAYVADRVDTTATAFLGLTMRCAQCHDHKFDPITQRDYYRFFAYFNNIAEDGLDGQTGNAKPFLKAPYPEQETRLASLTGEMTALDARLSDREASADISTAALESARSGWDATLGSGLAAQLTLASGKATGKPAFGPGYVAGAATLDGTCALDFDGLGDSDRGDAFSYGAWVKPATVSGNQTVFSKMDAPNGVRGWDLFLADGGRPMAHFIHEWPADALRVDSKETIPAGKWTHLFVTYDGTGKPGGVKLYINGRAVATDTGNDTLKSGFRSTTPLRVGGRYPGIDLKGEVDSVRLYRRVLPPDQVALLAETDPLRPALAAPPEKRTAEQKATLARHALRASDPVYRQAVERRAQLASEKSELEKAIPTTMVMEERTANPRPTFILERGQYDRPNGRVEAGLPGAFAARYVAPTKDRRAVAAWLVSPDNPLTARVAVNRLWQSVFGAGLVRTSENFGVQGEFPSHPELLDWLATEFVRTRWSVKGLVRLLVTSETYRQSSVAGPAATRHDPENRLLSHASRLRLPAELVRDQALSASGLLVSTIGGPSVKPYQPAGLWEEMSFKGGFSAQFYEQDHGDKLYRRSLYTFWKRTVPPPSLQTFDAPEREFCIVRRPATNTPLQALVLLNDPTYIEASRKLAERLIREAGPSPTARIDRAFRLVVARPASDLETRTLLRLANIQYSAFVKDPAKAKALLMVGESPSDPKLDPAEVAAWATLVSTIFNLDEAITRG